MSLLRKTQESCANCRFFYYAGLAGDHTAGRGLCMRFPSTVSKGTGDWCGEWQVEKHPEPEIAEDAKG